jgi:hypothetical protein
MRLLWVMEAYRQQLTLNASGLLSSSSMLLEVFFHLISPIDANEAQKE